MNRRVLVSGMCTRRWLNAELVEKFEPQPEIEEGPDQHEKGRGDEEASHLGEEIRWQAEWQEDEYEGYAGDDHLHAIAHGIGVLEQERGEENDAGTAP